MVCYSANLFDLKWYENGFSCFLRGEGNYIFCMFAKKMYEEEIIRILSHR